ncbi:PepSY domain-containing protein [Paraburkholderia madseniana]|uniref:PepSY domain-containing protein n=1 Tax=Paraburkholderia madseniana TaxID=2599607 RepID=A0AAP5BG96_9BURK|nr:MULTISPECIES: PepSY domain-containing protein [Paraburkholderia]MCX4148171.1 PepSY domain-containing protein [Paraburkholderia madseniana]MDN7151110.1 PepSY domain-containing protein [Paraburkholderia sp. WS6]MDQ6409990.1 PepSY domain-containing protein [Paraburkholderia madseniana]
MSTTTAQRATSATGAANAGYRTLWRWHFYAGLFVMPFLVVLAITGTLYCFQPQIEPLLYPHRLIVEPQSTPRLTEDALLAKARAAMPADARAVTAPIASASDRSTEFIFRLADGEKQSVYLNPYSGEVLGTLSVERRFMQVDRMLHRKLLLGKPGELLMELAACWTLVMIGTGIALWWPREKTTARAALVPRFSLQGRALWKNLHAVMGIWLALGALIFVLSGLPWTGSWGRQFKALASAANLGAPPGSWGGLPLRSAMPGMSAGEHAGVADTRAETHTAHRANGAHASSNEHGAHEANMDSMPGMVMDDLPLPLTPWAVGNTPVPQSADAHAAQALPLGRIVALVASLGVPGGYDIVLPASATGVYTVSYFPSDPKDERTLYIDQYSGTVLKDIRYGDYGAVSKAVSYGTSLHMGRYFGVANQILCAAISLGLAGMAVTGCVMWWKRRPQRSLGAPSRERAAPPMRGWKTGLVLLGIVFPLMGATLLAVWLADRTIFGRAMRQSA